MFGRLLVGVAAATTLALAATPAAAGWQWTEWGMSRQDVVAASNGKLVDQTGEGDLVLKGPIIVGGFTVDEIRFQFRQGRLARVFFDTSGQQTAAVYRALDAAFGRPVFVDEAAMWRRRYEDPAKDNLISVSVTRKTNDAGLMYEPLSKSARALPREGLR